MIVQARILRRATGSAISRETILALATPNETANDFSNLSFPEYRDLTSIQAESPAQDNLTLLTRSTHPRPTDQVPPHSCKVDAQVPIG
jgi:hypothetical protein